MRTRSNPEQHLLAAAWLDGVSKTFEVKNTATISRVNFSLKNQLLLSNRSVITEGVVRQGNIKVIISIGVRLPESITSLLDEYQYHDVEDMMDERNVSKMENILPITRACISRWLPYGNVLVHCREGISRSPTVVLDYLVNGEGFDYMRSVRFLKDARPCISPHHLFLRLVSES